MKNIEKQALPIIIEDDKPIAIVFFNKNRDRIIYMLNKADENDIVSLLEEKQVSSDKDK